MSDSAVSDIVSIFNKQQWYFFASRKLGLKINDEFRRKYPESSQLKLGIIREWQNRGNSDDFNVCDDLRKLKHEFFCLDLGSDDPKTSFSYTETAAASNGAQRQQSKDKDGGLGSYKLNGSKGAVLIISNSTESHEDAEKMRKLWVDKHNCNLYGEKIHKNQEADSMRSLLKELSESGATANNKPAYIVVIIATDLHSPVDCGQLQPGAEYLLGNDRRPVHIHEIKEYFSNGRAFKPSPIQGVPKLFIFKGCNGTPFQGNPKTEERKPEERRQYGPHLKYVPSLSDMITLYPPILHVASGAQGESRTEIDGVNQPSEDLTGREVISPTNAENTKKFLSTVHDAFDQYGKEMHVADIVTRINKMMIMSKDGDTGKIGATACESCLTTRFYLVPEAIAKK